MGTERQWVKSEFPDTYLGSSAGLDELEEALKKARAAEADGKWKDLELAVEDDYGYHCLKLYGMRLETDQEMQTRLNQEEVLKAKRDQEERRKYEELKKKFG